MGKRVQRKTNQIKPFSVAQATLGRACPKAKNSPKIYAPSPACLIFNFPQPAMPASVTELMALGLRPLALLGGKWNRTG